MEARRQNQREQRRRRVLRDDLSSGTEEVRGETRPRSAAALRRAYTESTLREGQPRITDFVPRRWWMLPLLATIGLVASAAVLALHYFRGRWEARVPALNLVVLDLTAAGSLGRWFSSFLLLLCAVMAWIVYHMRRHKTDDYHGRYGMWLWTAAALGLASLDAGTQLHAAPQQWLQERLGTAWLRNSASIGILTIGIPAVIIGLRMAIDMRRSRLACVTLVTAVLGYLGAALVALDVIPIQTPVWDVITCWGLLLLGHLQLWMCLMVFARHILLVALGVIDAPVVVRPKKSARRWWFWSRREGNGSAEGREKGRSKRGTGPVSRSPHKSVAEAEDDEDEDEASLPPRAASSSHRASPSAQPARDSEDDEDDDDEAEDEDRHLSRAERRRLRKQLRQQRKAG